jgi:hypothetical protein
MTWEVQELSPEQVVEHEHPSALHVLLTDGSWVVLEQAEISGDSLTGVVTDGEYRGQPLKGGPVVGIYLGDVEQVALQEKSMKSTAIGILAIAAVAGTIVMIEVVGSWNRWLEQP